MKHILLMVMAFVSAIFVARGQPDDPAVLLTNDYYVEAEVSNQKPFVGEQIFYIFRYYAFYLPDESPETLPDFQGFWLGRIFDTPTARAEIIANRQFYVGETLVEITPLTPGEITILPAGFMVQANVFRPGVELQSNSVTINVQSLPSGAPEWFNGAVGQFDGTLKVSRKTLALGEPLILEVTIEGIGNFELLSPPIIPHERNWRIYSEPAMYQDDIVGGIQFGQKTFRWEVIPLHSGTQMFPALTFSYFDPKLQQYRSFETDPIVVEVFPGTSGERSMADLEQFPQQPQVLHLEIIRQLKGGDTLPIVGLWFLWIIPPGLLFGLSVWKYERTRHLRKQKNYRKAHAFALALTHLEQTKDVVSTAFQFIRDKSGSPYQLNSLLHIDKTMSQSKIPHALRSRFVRLIAEAEGVKYAPEPETLNIIGLEQEIIEVLSVIDGSWGEANQ